MMDQNIRSLVQNGWMDGHHGPSCPWMALLSRETTVVIRFTRISENILGSVPSKKPFLSDPYLITTPSMGVVKADITLATYICDRAMYTYVSVLRSFQCFQMFLVQ